MDAIDMQKAQRFIEDNLEKPLSLYDLSSKSGISKFHFTRSFKAFTGWTFKSYHNKMRVQAAKALLKDRDNRITDVCYAIGYNDLSYFDRMFRRHEGMTPSSYRKQCRIMDHN